MKILVGMALSDIHVNITNSMWVWNLWNLHQTNDWKNGKKIFWICNQWNVKSIHLCTSHDTPIKKQPKVYRCLYFILYTKTIYIK